MPALDFNVLKGLAKRKKKDERGFYCHVFSRVNPVATVLRRRRQGFSAHKKMKRLPVLLTINKVFIAKQREWQRSDDHQNISVSFITSFMSVCCCPTSIPARNNDAIDPIRTNQRFQRGGICRADARAERAKERMRKRWGKPRQITCRLAPW